MNAQPFDIQPVIERLRAGMPELRLVGGAADYAAITGLRDFVPPCAYVLIAQERGEPNGANGRQRALVTFGVVLAVRNHSGARGAADDLRPLLGKLRETLMAWIPGRPGARAVQWLQGDVLDYDAGTLLWSDVYQTQYFIGRVP